MKKTRRRGREVKGKFEETIRWLLKPRASSSSTSSSVSRSSWWSHARQFLLFLLCSLFLSFSNTWSTRPVVLSCLPNENSKLGLEGREREGEEKKKKGERDEIQRQEQHHKNHYVNVQWFSEFFQSLNFLCLKETCCVCSIRMMIMMMMILESGKICLFFSRELLNWKARERKFRKTELNRTELYGQNKKSRHENLPHLLFFVQSPNRG